MLSELTTVIDGDFSSHDTINAILREELESIHQEGAYNSYHSAGQHNYIEGDESNQTGRLITRRRLLGDSEIVSILVPQQSNVQNAASQSLIPQAFRQQRIRNTRQNDRVRPREDAGIEQQRRNFRNRNLFSSLHSRISNSVDGPRFSR